MCTSSDVNQLVLNAPTRMLLELQTLRQYVYTCFAGSHASTVTAMQIHMVHVVNKKGFGDDGDVVWAFVWALLTS